MEKAIFENFAEGLLFICKQTTMTERYVVYNKEQIHDAVYKLLLALADNSKLFKCVEKVKREIIVDKCVRLYSFYEDENKKTEVFINHHSHILLMVS